MIVTTVAMCLRLPLCKRDHWHGFVSFGVNQAGTDGVAFCGYLLDPLFWAIVILT